MIKVTILSIFLLLLSFISGSFNLVNGQKTWCVAKPSTDPSALLENINYACSQIDCSILEKGCPCYSPNNLINHASVAMNLYFQCKGRNYWNCYFDNSALVVTTDPSFGSCIYEYKY